MFYSLCLRKHRVSPILSHTLQEHAFESSQKYKEGKFIIELAHMIKDNGWDWGTSSRDKSAVWVVVGGVLGNWMDGQMHGKEATRGGQEWWVIVWPWFGWFTINLCNSLPIPVNHTSWCTLKHTHTSQLDRETDQAVSQAASRTRWLASKTGSHFFLSEAWFYSSQYRDTPAIPAGLNWSVSLRQRKVWQPIVNRSFSGNLAGRRPTGPAWCASPVSRSVWLRWPKMITANPVDQGHASWASDEAWCRGLARRPERMGVGQHRSG